MALEEWIRRIVLGKVQGGRVEKRTQNTLASMLRAADPESLNASIASLNDALRQAKAEKDMLSHLEFNIPSMSNAGRQALASSAAVRPWLRNALNKASRLDLLNKKPNELAVEAVERLLPPNVTEPREDPLSPEARTDYLMWRGDTAVEQSIREYVESKMPTSYAKLASDLTIEAIHMEVQLHDDTSRRNIVQSWLFRTFHDRAAYARSPRWKFLKWHLRHVRALLAGETWARLLRYNARTSPEAKISGYTWALLVVPELARKLEHAPHDAKMAAFMYLTSRTRNSANNERTVPAYMQYITGHSIDRSTLDPLFAAITGRHQAYFEAVANTLQRISLLVKLLEYYNVPDDADKVIALLGKPYDVHKFASKNRHMAMRALEQSKVQSINYGRLRQQGLPATPGAYLEMHDRVNKISKELPLDKNYLNVTPTKRNTRADKKLYAKGDAYWSMYGNKTARKVRKNTLTQFYRNSARRRRWARDRRIARRVARRIDQANMEN